MQVFVDFCLKYYLGKKDANYVSVSQQNVRKSGLQNSLNCGKAFILYIVMLIKLGVLINFSCVH